MKYWRSRRLWAGVLLGLALVALTAGLGPFARSRAAAEARRRGYELGIVSVRPGWFSIRLLGVTASSPSLRARVDELRVRLRWSLGPESIELNGGELTLTRRDAANPSPARGDAGRGLPVTGSHLTLRSGGAGDTTRAELTELSFERTPEHTYLQAHEGFVERRGLRVSLHDLKAELLNDRDPVRASATSAEVAWSSPPPGDVVADPEVGTSASPDVAPSSPLLDPRQLQARVRDLTRAISERFPHLDEVTIDGLVWKITVGADRVPLTLGPGPAKFIRSPGRVEARFAAETGPGAPSMSIRALLPTDGGDSSITVEGGPISLAALGLREGALGLTDVDGATVGGRMGLTLAADGASLAFDADGSARGISLYAKKLASDVVRGMDLGFRARGVLDAEGALRVDDFSATLGVVHLLGGGLLERRPDHFSAEVHLELPSTACQSVLESAPTALLPDLFGARWSGTLGARARLAFDTRNLEELQLSYDVQDDCRAVQVPAALSRAHFKQPFAHRIYLPDGTMSEQTSGPGTPNWTALDDISPFLQVAVLTTEDGAFSHHRGFNREAIRSSLIANLKAGAFVRGASTISMQLAKNLFLTRGKTLSRKLEEVALTDYLEQAFSKDELMELYLNVVEFGPAVYGVTAAAEYYFGRAPSELTLPESLFLSTLLPAPLRYGAMRDGPQVPESWMRTLRSLMRIARRRGLISDADLADGLSQSVTFWHGGTRPPSRPPVHQRALPDSLDDDTATP